MTKTQESPYAIPAAIFAAGMVIAAAIMSDGGQVQAAAAAPAPVQRVAPAGCGV